MNTTRALTALALIALAGCSSSGSSSAPGPSVKTDPPAPATMPSAASAKVDKAAAIARAIQARPENADEILRQNNMTERQYEDLLYEIAADPAMSEAYNARMGT